MRIGFSGAACTGKTTTIQAFLNKWPQYQMPTTSYRDLIKNNKHSKNTSKKLQKQILHFMVDQSKQYTRSDKVVYDRVGIDNIVYSMWAFEKGIKGFTDNFISDSISLVRENMRNLDIIFLTTREKMGPIEQNNIREVDPIYVAETDNIFRAIHQNLTKTGASPFFPQNDSPALIEISGTVDERVEQISQYVTTEGEIYGEEQSLVNVDEIMKMERLLKEQKEFLAQDKKFF